LSNLRCFVKFVGAYVYRCLWCFATDVCGQCRWSKSETDVDYELIVLFKKEPNTNVRIVACEFFLGIIACEFFLVIACNIVEFKV
jgi:hypothetical protein